MNKATKRTVNHLRKLVGHRIIRTKPTAERDFSYMEDPLILKRFTAEGKMVVQYDRRTFDRKYFSAGEWELPLEFTDHNWKLYSRVLNVADSELSKWKGKKIIRTTPSKCFGSNDFMSEPAKLIKASKYHLIV